MNNPTDTTPCPVHFTTEEAQLWDEIVLSQLKSNFPDVDAAIAAADKVITARRRGRTA